MSREPGKDAQGSGGNYTWGRKPGQWRFLWTELAYGENTGHDGKRRTAHAKEQKLKAWRGRGEGAAITVCESETQAAGSPLLVSLSDPVPRTRCQLSLPIKPQPQDTKSNDTDQQQEATRPQAGIYEPD